MATTHHSDKQTRGERGKFAKPGAPTALVTTATSANTAGSALALSPYFSNLSLTPAAAPGADGRFSRPSGQSGLWSGAGIGSFAGVITRRAWDTQTLAWLAACRNTGIHGLSEWGAVAPLILLRVMTYLHPLASQAVSNNLDLAFAPDDIRIVAVEKTERPDGSQTEKVNSEGTAALDRMWDRLNTFQPELGGYLGLMRTGAKRGMDAGMHLIEGVPSSIVGEGVGSAYTIDPLTIRFRDTDVGRVMEQRQIGNGQPVRLPVERVFHASLDGDTDNPYGEPLFKAFPFDGLADFREQGNLAELFEGIIWPRLVVPFPLLEAIQFAKDNANAVLLGKGPIDPISGRATDETPENWAFAQQEAFKARMQNLRHNDQIFTIKGSGIDTINLADGLVGMDSSMQRRMIRIASALRHPATMLNIPVGGTQGLGVTTSRSHSKQMESMRVFAAAPVLMLANLHLRLLGLPFVARLKAEKIHTTDKLADAQAEAISLANILVKRNQNWISNEEASIEATGSGPFADPPAPVAPVDPAIAETTVNPTPTAMPADNTQNSDKAENAKQK